MTDDELAAIDAKVTQWSETTDAEGEVTASLRAHFIVAHHVRPLVGPNPCYQDTSSGDSVSAVDVTTTGTGGFAAIDISCQSGASVSDVTVHGGTIALFEDRATTLTGERFTPGPNAKTCAPPWFVTGPTSGITVADVVSAGGVGVVHAPSGVVSISGQTVTNVACRQP